MKKSNFPKAQILFTSKDEQAPLRPQPGTHKVALGGYGGFWAPYGSLQRDAP